MLDDISTGSVTKYLNENIIDWAFLVPSVVREILSTEGTNQITCNVLTMGSPIYFKDKIAFQKRFDCNLIEVWGNSEGLGTITQPEDVFTRPKSIGRPFFTDFVDVISTGDGLTGTLYGISDNEFTEYIGNKELTDSTLKNGFIISEDLGCKDENGYFYLTGRTNDIIVVNGIKVFPLDIEKQLLENKGVLDCCVLGVADEIGNDIVSAVLVVSEHAESSSLIIDSLNEKLANTS